MASTELTSAGLAAGGEGGAAPLATVDGGLDAVAGAQGAGTLERAQAARSKAMGRKLRCMAAQHSLAEFAKGVLVRPENDSTQGEAGASIATSRPLRTHATARASLAAVQPRMSA
jgi:hypothetical protein